MKFDGDPEIGTDLINHYPARFLFGTDEVAPKTQDKYLKIYFQYDPLWRALDKQASEKVRTRNSLRIFDAARVKVRAWEKAQGFGRRRSPLTPEGKFRQDNREITADRIVIMYRKSCIFCQIGD